MNSAEMNSAEMNSMDINCDMGEIPEAIDDGTQESMMPSLTSVNIACGGHAGDRSTMLAAICATCASLCVRALRAYGTSRLMDQRSTRSAGQFCMTTPYVLFAHRKI